MYAVLCCAVLCYTFLFQQNVRIVLQMNGFKGMFNTVEQSLNEAGRERILGTAVTNAAPGDTFNILLDG